MAFTDKKQARAHFRAIRESFSSNDFAEMNQGIGLSLKNFFKNLHLPKNETIHIAAYRAKENEANIDALWRKTREQLAFSRHQWSFPRLLPESGEMQFCEALSEGDFILNKWGIWEPNASCKVVEAKKIHICFVPLLAIDKQGNRLGHGKGYYDRFLKNFLGLKVGVCFDWQLSKVLLPHNSHDIPLDVLVTDKKVRVF